MDTEQIRQQVAVGANENILSAAYVNNTTYEIVDSDARVGVKANSELIDEISSMIQGGVHYLGKSATELSDGSDINPISVYVGSGTDTSSVTAVDGDMVSYSPGGDKKDLEFIWGSNRWNEFGSSGALKALAFKDTASATYTPAGSVGISATTIGALDVTDASAQFNSVSVAAQLTLDSYTPAGTISCGAYTPAGTVSVDQVTGVKGSVTVYEVSSAAFTGDAKTLSAGFTGSETTLTASMTAGSISNGTTAATLPALPTLSASTPAVSVTENKTDVLATATVTNGVLSFGNTSVLSGASAALNAAPTVGYSSAYDTALTGTITGGTVAGDATCSYKPAGTIAVETYTPTGSVSVAKETKTPEVSVNAFTPTASFGGTAATLKADFTGTPVAPTGHVDTTEFTPSMSSFTGKVTVPEHTHNAAFGGTEATITVS